MVPVRQTYRFQAHIDIETQPRLGYTLSSFEQRSTSGPAAIIIGVIAG